MPTVITYNRSRRNLTGRTQRYNVADLVSGFPKTDLSREHAIYLFSPQFFRSERRLDDERFPPVVRLADVISIQHFTDSLLSSNSPDGKIYQIGIDPGKTKEVVYFDSENMHMDVQLFFARRIRLEAFSSDAARFGAVRKLLPSFEARKVLLQQTYSHTFDEILKDWLRDELKSPTTTGLSNSEKYVLTANQDIAPTISSLLNDGIAPEQIMNLLERFIAPQCLKPEQLASGFIGSLYGYSKDKPLDDVFDDLKFIHEYTEGLSDKDIGEMLVSLAKSSREQVFFSSSDSKKTHARLTQIEGLLDTLNVEGKVAFNENLSTYMKGVLSDFNSVGHRDPSRVAILLAIRANGGNVIFSHKEDRENILKYLTAKEVAIGFYNPEDISLVVDALIDRLIADGDNLNPSFLVSRLDEVRFLFDNNEDWTTGLSEGNEKIRSKIARSFAKKLIKQFDVDIKSGNQRYPQTSIRNSTANGAQVDWSSQGLDYGLKSGLTQFVKTFAGVIGQNWKMHRKLVNHLLVKGRTYDCVELAKRNCIGPKKSRKLLEAHAITVLGVRNSKALSHITRLEAEELTKAPDNLGPIVTTVDALECFARLTLSNGGETKTNSPEQQKPIAISF
jgi:hypothetical protein